MASLAAPGGSVMKAGHCFVIQPFDKGKYDKRYRDVFAPAIVEAGLEPYRVDNDPSASIPIDEIADKIKSARVCFAEISQDNPNVWFEIGYALAARKEVCLVSSDERVGKFPFDVQHRQIITYLTSSSSDFDDLKSKIKERLCAILKKLETLDSLNDNPLIAEVDGLSHHETAALVVIFEGRFDPSAAMSISQIETDMDRLGYTKAATRIALEKLRRKSFVEGHIEEVYDRMAEEQYNMTFFRLSERAVDWIIANETQLNLRTER